MKKAHPLLLVALVLWGTTASADVPHLIRYQGQAVDSQGVPLEGPYTLTFRLYDAETGGAKVWEEIQANVVLQGGHFSVLLGQVTPLTAMDWSRPCWLSVQVGTEPELSPRQRITSVPLALRAEVAESLASPTNISARVYHSATQSISNNGNTPLSFDSEDYDHGGLHETATNTSRLTAAEAGRYLVWGVVTFSANATGNRRLHLRLNGADNLAFTQLMAVATAGVETRLPIFMVVNLAANDYVEVLANQNSGGSLAIPGAAGNTSFGMAKLP